MGLDIGSLDFLMRHRNRIKGECLQLGRQGMHLVPPFSLYEDARKIFNKYDDSPFENIIDTNGHTEKLFTYLGASAVESMDYSSYEQATIIHDLNQPITDDLKNRFDFIYDGGTIEHVFDIKMVFDNIKRMLKVGGTFVSVNCGNNFCGHGFYQFSPELYRSVFSKEAGYNLFSLQLMNVGPNPEPVDVPNNRGMRQEISTANIPIYICAAAEKLEEKNTTQNIQQSDYITIWGGL
jgi:SAM-dependent methyltransferase